MEPRNIPLYKVHQSLNAKMIPFAGFNMPVIYSSDIEEHMAVRKGVGIFDVSHMGEFFIRGNHALDLIQWISSNDASKLTPGKAQYSCMPNDSIGIVDDLIIYMINDNEYMLVVNASNIEKDWNWIQKQNTMEAEIENASDNICLLAIQGPKATDALQSLTSVPLNDIKFYHFEVGTFAEVENVIISGTGYTGSGGFEIYIPSSKATEIWNAIVKAGESFDIKPVGLGARDTLRLEKGYCLYGNDIDDHTSPMEAGLGWITKFSKDFVNSQFLKEQKENGVDKKLIGFKMADKGIPRRDHEIRNNNNEMIGVVTSGTISPMLGIGIGLGYVDVNYSKPGTDVFISVRNKLLKAVVSTLPFV